MIRLFESKVRKVEEEIAGNRKRVRALLAALRQLAKHNERLAQVLRSFSPLAQVWHKLPQNRRFSRQAAT